MHTTIDPDFAEPRVTMTPERRLWATCLLDGVREAVTARFERLKDREKWALPVEQLPWPERWLMDPTWRHIGSFVWICEQLGYEPDHMREQVLLNARGLMR